MKKNYISYIYLLQNIESKEFDRQAYAYYENAENFLKSNHTLKNYQIIKIPLADILLIGRKPPLLTKL